MKVHTSLAAIVLCCTIAACDSVPSANGAVARLATDSSRADSIAHVRQDSVNRAQPGYVVDSILPPEEELRRFRDRIGGSPVKELTNGSASRDALVERLVADVARGDTADLRSALVTGREFADLIYPSSPYTHPPYRQAPQLVWMMIQNPSTSGYLRLLRRRGEKALELKSYECKRQPEIQGDNTLWTDCTLRLATGNGPTSVQKWFGTIVERNGRFKLMSFRNQF